MDAVDILKLYLDLGDSIVSEEYLSGISYKFYDNTKFSEFRNGFELNKIYWNEILSRIHWASINTIQRNNSWVKGILHSYSTNNFLPFASSLRSFVESSGDSRTSLNSIPLTIARDFKQISDSVNGRKINPEINPELEEMLIHFHYARRLDKSEKESVSVPKSHKAEFVGKYIEILDNYVENGSVQKMYSELCQFIHPASYSVLLSMESAEYENYTIMSYNKIAGKTTMKVFVDEFQESIISVCQDGYNNALVLLKLLNLFNVSAFSTPKLNSIELTNIPIWEKVVKLIK